MKVFHTPSVSSAGHHSKLLTGFNLLLGPFYMFGSQSVHKYKSVLIKFSFLPESKLHQHSVHQKHSSEKHWETRTPQVNLQKASVSYRQSLGLIPPLKNFFLVWFWTASPAEIKSDNPGSRNGPGLVLLVKLVLVWFSYYIWIWTSIWQYKIWTGSPGKAGSGLEAELVHSLAIQDLDWFCKRNNWIWTGSSSKNWIWSALFSVLCILTELVLEWFS